MLREKLMPNAEKLFDFESRPQRWPNLVNAGGAGFELKLSSVPQRSSIIFELWCEKQLPQRWPNLVNAGEALLKKDLPQSWKYHTSTFHSCGVFVPVCFQRGVFKLPTRLEILPIEGGLELFCFSFLFFCYFCFFCSVFSARCPCYL